MTSPGRVGERVRSRFWLLPAACCATALAAALVLPELDELVGDDLFFLFEGGPAGARSLLSSIVTAMISVTGLVFSITVVALQLASSQFSPRVLRTYLRSRLTQLTLGVFTATFLYALVVLRSVRGDAGAGAFVPRLAVTGAFLLVLASVALFIAYIHHITQSIRASTIVRSVGDETRSTIAAVQEQDGEPAPAPPLGPADAVVRSAGHGVVTAVDAAALARLARRAGCVLHVLPRVGEFVATGAPLVAVHGSTSAGTGVEGVDEDAVRGAVGLGRERSMEQDVAFGLRQLVDIAERALSPGVNDPTTAVQALDEVHDLLRRLAGAPDPSPVVRDEEGTARVVVERAGFADHLDLAVDEVLHHGADSVQVPPRLLAMLDDVLDAARPEHRAVLEAKRARVREAAGRGR
ncbi:DUF2254 domain-containing protein [Quadrisphaera sp. DSM 44207]|uniref:DUF2254 domain-containing protein n=1 Tax=Quadrisphaera sp. DSM 44207 TaxID=1881057 RepID=UPI00088B0CCF|nr:DUF2254 domain-containing protein [Quadrisphaera sp. DSM 44207]SDQ08540.1 Uncharacterized membrane protein [Quadrisphaera sp. DSM 44207]